MNKRDFFKIIIKLVGFYALISTIFDFIPSNIGFLIIEFEPLFLIWILGATVFTILVYVFLILKTDHIINLLKIDKGFDDERIEIGNLNSLNILKFALIVIGGFLMVDHFPNFLRYTYLAFRNQVSQKGLNDLVDITFGTPKDYFNWSVVGINSILGVIFIKNYEQITKLLSRKKENKASIGRLIQTICSFRTSLIQKDLVSFII